MRLCTRTIAGNVTGSHVVDGVAPSSDGSLGNDPLAQADAMQGSMRFKTRRPSLSTGAEPSTQRVSQRRKSSTPAGVTSRARRVSVRWVRWLSGSAARTGPMTLAGIAWCLWKCSGERGGEEHAA